MNIFSNLPMKFHNGACLINKMRYWAKFPLLSDVFRLFAAPCESVTSRGLNQWEFYQFENHFIQLITVSFGSEKVLARPRRALLIKDLMLPGSTVPSGSSANIWEVGARQKYCWVRLKQTRRSSETRAAHSTGGGGRKMAPASPTDRADTSSLSARLPSAPPFLNQTLS